MERKPLPEEFKEFIQLLNSEKVRYLVLGGWAVSIHGNPRATGDIDFFIGIDSKNVDKMKVVLAKFGLKNVPVEYFEKNNILRMGVPPTRIEILTGASGIEFDSCYKNKKRMDVEGLKINFISKKDLIVNKKAAGRPKDIVDVNSLE